MLETRKYNYFFFTFLQQDIFSIRIVTLFENLIYYKFYIQFSNIPIKNASSHPNITYKKLKESSSYNKIVCK